MNLEWLTDYWEIVAAAIAAAGAGAGAIFYFRKSAPRTPAAPAPEIPSEKAPAAIEAPPVVEVQPLEPLPAPASKDLSNRLARTRGSWADRLGKFLGRSSHDTFGSTEWDEMEEALLQGDVGLPTSTLLLERVKQRLKANGSDRSLRELLWEEGEGLIAGLPHGRPDLSQAPKPYVISVVGVNGVGKTTTIGKLAHHFSAQGKTVLLGAGDTFRAAAIQQLRVWSERANTQFVTGREGGDPGAVAFDSLSAAQARGVDVVLFDTAGRLHTKVNLMDELKRVHKVMTKVIPAAPHETWLVVDGTLGQNSVQQAKEFGKTLPISGVVVTKLDGTAKGGAVLAIASELKLPVRFIGVGEAKEDLIPFEPKPFLGAILGA